MGLRARRLPVRPSSDRIVAGVCRAVSDHLGVDVTVVRVAFIALTLAFVGIPAYLLGWLLFPRAATTQPAHEAPRDSTVPTIRAAGLALTVLGTVLLARHFGLTLPDAYTWPALCVVFGVGVVAWRVRPVASVGRVSAVRILAGTIAIAVGIGVFVAANLSLSVVRDGLLSTLLVVGGLALILGPWVAVLARDRRAERLQRIRADERAEVAAHLHDSVLQTLALIQRSDDPAEASALARRQERELRGWLYGEPRDPLRATLKVAVERLVGAIEDRHGAKIDLVIVGDTEFDSDVDSLLAAAGEAMTNAALWSGRSEVGVYVEAGDEQVEVFVRDRGRGFDPEAVGDEHHGIRDSIRGRMLRLGGDCEIVSAPGEGTEVRLTLSLDRS